MTIPDAGYMSGNGAMSGIPITPDEQKRIVTELTKEADSNLKVGNLYYVVSNRWFRSWQEYTDQDASNNVFDKHSNDVQSMALSKSVERPGPIDNSDIVLKGVNTDGDYMELRRSLLEGSDYVVVPQRVWEMLLEWYGGGPAVPRKLITQGDANKQYNVEVYPLCLKLLDSRDNSQSVIRLSRKASLQELYEKVCKLRQVEPEKARIRDYFNQQKHEILEDSNKTIEKSELQMDQDILLEVEVDGFWPPGRSMDSTGNELALVLVEPPRSSVSIAGGPSMSNGHSSSYSTSFGQGSFLGSGSADMEDGYVNSKSLAKSEGKGLSGLQNLGNTCFMNSAVQCLVHTPPIAEYFLQDYSDEINRQNPLGLHGELALAFGELLRKLWSSGRTAIAPRAFKSKLARFAPQFSGYNQHDSQELLAFLLDGLHEDLNRVKQKPYFEAKDSDGRPDEEVADECWRYHKARNDSIIVDVCQGQYKSTLVCPECNKISITFDPFMYLSLPLPSTVTRTITVTVFYGDGSGLPMPYTVKVLKHGICRDLTQALATECCLRIDESLLLAEVYQKNIYRYLDSPLEPLSTIKDEEHIVAYRVPKIHAETRLEISHRYQENVETNFVRKRFSEPTEATRFRSLSDSLKAFEWKLFLTPLVIYMEKPQSRTDIELAVRKAMLPLKRKSLSCSTKIMDDKENSSSEMREESNKSSSSCHSGSGNELEGVEREETPSSKESALQLCITDDRGSNCRPIFKDSKIEPRPLIKVTLDWTSREFELYDPSYLKDLSEVHKSGMTTKKTKQEAISLFSCLDAFLKEEPLGPDDMWFCPGCKEHRQATKKLDLWRLPEILVFHLKRFSYSRYMKNKLETFVNFDIHNLDLSKYVKCKDASGRSHVYELYAISNHYGGLGGGHYSAYAKLIEENRWYHFDDSHVSAVTESEIKTSAAYVLFYQRVKNTAVASGEPSQNQVSTSNCEK